MPVDVDAFPGEPSCRLSSFGFSGTIAHGAYVRAAGPRLLSAPSSSAFRGAVVRRSATIGRLAPPATARFPPVCECRALVVGSITRTPIAKPLFIPLALWALSARPPPRGGAIRARAAARRVRRRPRMLFFHGMDTYGEFQATTLAHQGWAALEWVTVSAPHRGSDFSRGAGGPALRERFGYAAARSRSWRLLARYSLASASQADMFARVRAAADDGGSAAGDAAGRDASPRRARCGADQAPLDGVAGISEGAALGAAVCRGAAVGGGVMLALAADLRWATPATAFRLAVAAAGRSPLLGATARLPFRLYVDDPRLGADAARTLGFVHAVAGDEAAASRRARDFAARAAKAAPAAPRRRDGAPALEIEARVAAIVREFLDGDVAADAPLLDAGIDSLSASELATKLAAAFGSGDVGATLLFDHPSVAAVAALLAEAAAAPTVAPTVAPPAEPTDRDGRPLVAAELRGSVAVLALDRPDVFNGAYGMEPALAAALDRVGERGSCSGCVVTGRGHAYHVAEHRNQIDFEPASRRFAFTRDYLVAYFAAFVAFPKPLVAALNGSAYGGAATSTSHGDAVVAVDAAELSFPFRRWRVVPEGCATAHLARLAGQGCAARLGAGSPRATTPAAPGSSTTSSRRRSSSPRRR
ncbi:enoyl-CoA delta-isomerase 2 [Aureococcus anophagefferens]|nr:enoyl-CoA delta-isomerase 2 [Aureococcus anophagefferens]